MSEWNNVECPVCGFRLQGSPFSGFRCVKCHAYYSAKFIRHVRRTNIKHMLKKFEPPNVVVKEEFVVPSVAVEKAIEQAKEHVKLIPLNEIKLHTKTVRKVIKHAKRKDVKEIVKRHTQAHKPSKVLPWRKNRSRTKYLRRTAATALKKRAAARKKPR